MSCLTCAIVGGESTGKTTLCMELASFEWPYCITSCWCAEWARGFLDGRDFDSDPFGKDDFISIAKGHRDSVLTSKASLLSSSTKSILFVDTDAITTFLWCEELIGEGNCPQEVIDISKEKLYDVFFVTDWDVPYEEDPQRFLPDLIERKRFHNKLIKTLDDMGISYHLVSGDKHQRKRQCIEILEPMLGF